MGKEHGTTRGTTRGRPFARGNRGRPRGSRNRATLLREHVVTAILAELERRNENCEAKGVEGGYLATLGDKAFTDLLKQIIPRNLDVGGEGFGVVMAALQARAGESA